MNNDIINYGAVLNDILNKRESIRNYSVSPILTKDLYTILDAATGYKTYPPNLRKAPSAGACYPLTLYAVCNLKDLKGLYRYNLTLRKLEICKTIEQCIHEYNMSLHTYISRCCLKQYWMTAAPVYILITTNWYNSPTLQRYGKRGIMYTYMDVGYMAENIHLMATALGLGSCSIGAFEDNEINKVYYEKDLSTLLVITVGVPEKSR